MTGLSGSGKSSVFRALAGLWPLGHGNISFPQEARIFTLPQRSYFPLGSLRQAVAYPTAGEATDDAAIRDLVGRRADRRCPIDLLTSRNIGTACALVSSDLRRRCTNSVTPTLFMKRSAKMRSFMLSPQSSLVMPSTRLRWRRWPKLQGLQGWT